MLDDHQPVVNVVGEAEEAICDYRTCHHKLSEHGPSSRSCKCCHPSNKAMGISASIANGI